MLTGHTPLLSIEEANDFAAKRLRKGMRTVNCAGADILPTYTEVIDTINAVLLKRFSPWPIQKYYVDRFAGRVEKGHTFFLYTEYSYGLRLDGEDLLQLCDYIIDTTRDIGECLPGCAIMIDRCSVTRTRENIPGLDDWQTFTSWYFVAKHTDDFVQFLEIGQEELQQYSQ